MAMQWDYWVQTLIIQQGLQDALNEAGGKGWELVSVTQDGTATRCSGNGNGDRPQRILQGGVPDRSASFARPTGTAAREIRMARLFVVGCFEVV
jgi:hypothetical protein